MISMAHGYNIQEKGGLAALSILNMKKIKRNGIAIIQKEEETQERKGRKKECEKGMEQRLMKNTF